jgi:protoporphyrinogen oxidase
MKIGIIGGGMMGLVLAHRLSRQGHAIAVFEHSKQLGGLNTYHDYGSFTWDRFYHAILPSDSSLIDFLKEIGLGKELRWQSTLTGYYEDEKFYSISNSIEFLRFPPLSLLGKIRLAITLLYGSKIDNWQRLEKILVEDWLIKLSGKSTYEKFWKPLLLAKLGESYRRGSAVFIWSYIKRLFSARDSSLQKEQLGYVKGGYKTVFDRLEKLLLSSGNEVLTNAAVERVEVCPTGGLNLKYQGTERHFDKVIFTGPTNVLEQIAEEDLVAISGDRDRVEYLGVICLVLVTRRPLVPYYVVNIADGRIPFTGVIGMTNLVSVKNTDKLHLTYLPKYVLSSDPLLQETDDELRKLFVGGIRLMFPDLNNDDIVSIHINRATKVQPLQILNYSKIVPTVTTASSDFFVLNTAQFVNNTLNNNTVVAHVDDFLKNKFSRF